MYWGEGKRGHTPPFFWLIGKKKDVGKIVTIHTTIFLILLKFFVWFNKDHKNTYKLSTEILNLIGKHSSFNRWCNNFLFGEINSIKIVT